MLTPATALALQRTIGNANVARLARAPRAAVARAPAATAIPALSSDWDDVRTYTDAAQNYRLGALWLQEDVDATRLSVSSRRSFRGTGLSQRLR